LNFERLAENRTRPELGFGEVFHGDSRVDEVLRKDRSQEREGAGSPNKNERTVSAYGRANHSPSRSGTAPTQPLERDESPQEIEAVEAVNHGSRVGSFWAYG
jgi:hypothetical protein